VASEIDGSSRRRLPLIRRHRVTAAALPIAAARIIERTVAGSGTAEIDPPPLLSQLINAFTSALVTALVNRPATCRRLIAVALWFDWCSLREQAGN
jgi:hypothetical protein